MKKTAKTLESDLKLQKRLVKASKLYHRIEDYKAKLDLDYDDEKQPEIQLNWAKWERIKISPDTMMEILELIQNESRELLEQNNVEIK